jgi:hypothetical protein
MRLVPRILNRLLRGQPEVLALLDHHAFAKKPPTEIQAHLDDYRFSDWEIKNKTRNWRVSTYKCPYSPLLKSRDKAFIGQKEAYQ